MAATTLPRPRKRNLWNPGTEEQLWARIMQRDDRPISAVIRDFCREKGLSYHTARAKYYRRLRSGVETAPAPAETVLEDLAAFLRDASQVPGVDLSAFLGGLKVLASLAAGGGRLRELEAEAENLRRERDDLARQFEEHRRRRETLAAAYRSLDALVEEFSSLTSIGKVAGLGDFARRLRLQVDEFGQAIERS